jgi:hypothetical protein
LHAAQVLRLPASMDVNPILRSRPTRWLEKLGAWLANSIPCRGLSDPISLVSALVDSLQKFVKVIKMIFSNFAFEIQGRRPHAERVSFDSSRKT